MLWTAVVANLSPLVSLYLPSLHSSSPVHLFPGSSCASRCSCNDESMAAVCLCSWHRDVSLQVLTPSLFHSLPPLFFSSPKSPALSISLSPSLYLLPLSVSLSFILSLSVMRHCLASCLSDGTDKNTHIQHQQQTGTELHDLPIDFHWGHFWNSPSDLSSKW